MKNDNYNLKDLLKFWKGQEKLNFQGIKVLLEINENKKTPKDRKRWIILAGLRGLGLFEIGYKKPTIDEILKEDEEEKKVLKRDIPGEIEWSKNKTDVGIQTFKCRIINGTIEFWKILN